MDKKTFEIEQKEQKRAELSVTLEWFGGKEIKMTVEPNTTPPSRVMGLLLDVMRVIFLKVVDHEIRQPTMITRNNDGVGLV